MPLAGDKPQPYRSLIRLPAAIARAIVVGIAGPRRDHNHLGRLESRPYAGFLRAREFAGLAGGTGAVLSRTGVRDMLSCQGSGSGSTFIPERTLVVDPTLRSLE